MPPSMALASDRGIAATARLIAGQRPARMMKSPETRKAPTAYPKPPWTGGPLARSAAPGVVQATMIGMRVLRLSRIPQIPVTTQSASRPEAAWAGLAPAATTPRRITANEDAKPTKAARTPLIVA